MAPLPKAVDAWEYCSLLSPVVALAVNVVFQVALVRARRGGLFHRSMIEGFLAGLAGLAAIEGCLIMWRGVSLETLAISCLVNAPAYAALSYCYFGVANLGHTSIRIRLYAEMAASPDGISIQEIERIYNEKAFMEMRLQRLIEGGNIIEKDGRYFVGDRKLLLVAKIIFATKRFILGEKNDFESRG